MTPGADNILDPNVCSCCPGSYHTFICNKIKWSTLSIIIALLIIIVYASSGLYTLIDVTTMMTSTNNEAKDTVLWPVGSSLTMILSWTSLTIYFAVVLFITILLCGIQLSKPWLLFVWSIIMIIMLLADGIVTVLTLRQHQQQAARSTKLVHILFFVMIVRLVVSLFAIFFSIFHFRRLNKAHSEYMNRQRMLLRYNSVSPSPSYHSSWTRSAVCQKNTSDDHHIPDLPPSITLPRAKVATVQRNPTMTMFHSLSPQHNFNDNLYHQPPIHRHNDDFRYNIPLHERFRQQQQQITGLQEL